MFSFLASGQLFSCILITRGMSYPFFRPPTRSQKESTKPILYFLGGVVGPLGSFICYRPIFQWGGNRFFTRHFFQGALPFKERCTNRPFGKFLNSLIKEEKNIEISLFYEGRLLLQNFGQFLVGILAKRSLFVLPIWGILVKLFLFFLPVFSPGGVT